jgi:hypothetical protein
MQEINKYTSDVNCDVETLDLKLNKYSINPVSADSVSTVSVIRDLKRPENIKWKFPEINDS